jgi:hypothetical protein
MAFKVTGDVKVQADFHRKRVVISFVTDDGRMLNLETDYQTLDRIHQEIVRQLQD